MVGGNLICWNCRGAKCSDFLREMKDLLRLYKTCIVVLIEPKISGVKADIVCKNLGKTHRCISEVVGFSDDVWLLWDESEIRVRMCYASKFFLHAIINQVGERPGS